MFIQSMTWTVLGSSKHLRMELIPARNSNSLFLIYIEGISNLKILLISSFIVKIRLAGQLAKYRKQVLFTCFRVGSRDCEPWAYVTSIPKVIDDWFGCFLGALKKTKNSFIFLIFQLYWPSKKSEKIIFSILTS